MTEQPSPKTRCGEAAGRVLALMVGCDGHLDTCDLAALHDLDAYERIGIGRERFDELARECLHAFGSSDEHSWIPIEEEARVDAMLDAVTDGEQRRLVCALASAVLQPGGGADKEHLLLEHALARWHIDRAALRLQAAAIGETSGMRLV